MRVDNACLSFDGDGDAGILADHTAPHEVHDDARDLGEVDSLLVRAGKQIMHDRHGADTLGCLGECSARLGRVAATRLDAQQRGDRLQVVLHAMVDLADRRVLDLDLALAPPRLGEILHEHERPGASPIDR